MTPKRWIFLILGGLFFIVLVQNTEVVSIKFLFWKLSMSRIIMIPLIFLIGGLVGFFLGRKSWDW